MAPISKDKGLIIKSTSMKKIVLERLASEKFQPLKRESLAFIQGGKATGADQEPTGVTEEQFVEDPQNPGHMIYQHRIVYKTWSSDDVTDGKWCFYGIGTAYGRWY
jgi:hypothetical protein